MITQETYHTKWNGGKQNKYHSEIMTILGCSAAETGSYIPQHR